MIVYEQWQNMKNHLLKCIRHNDKNYSNDSIENIKEPFNQ